MGTQTNSVGLHYKMDKPRHRILSVNPVKKYVADPGALGLFAFAVVTFMAGAINCNWHTEIDRAIFAPAIAYGGLAQVVAGIIDLIRGEKISGSTFTAFGFFWVSQGMWAFPSLDTEALYPNADEFRSARGYYLIGWSFVAFATFLAMLKTTYAQITLLAMVWFDFTTLGILEFHENRTFRTVVGYFMVVTAALAWYIGAAFLLKDKSVIELPLIPVGLNEDEDDPLEGPVAQKLKGEQSIEIVHDV